MSSLKAWTEGTRNRPIGFRIVTNLALAGVVLGIVDWLPFPVIRLFAGLVAPVWVATWFCGPPWGSSLAVIMPVLLERVDGGWFGPRAQILNTAFTLLCIAALSVLAQVVACRRAGLPVFSPRS